MQSGGSGRGLRCCRVHRVPMRDPGDTSSIAALIDSGAVEPASIVAILGKTEGNGCVNDFTRQYAVNALQRLLAGYLGTTPEEVGRKVAMVMSGGTEGGLSPHFVLICVEAAADAARWPKALAAGVAFTRKLEPEELGRMAQVEATAEAVRTAMIAAGIDDPADVHYVQVKCPLLTSERVADARARGRTVATHDTYHSMALSRAASALGVALALEELSGTVAEAAIGRDMSLWSARASTSAGVELTRNEVMVLGNSARWAGNLVIGHAVMRDPIDLPAVNAALETVGLAPRGQLDAAQQARVAAVLAKAEPPRSGLIRGCRHIMLDDSDIQATRHARAVVGGVIAGVVGRTDIFVSGGAEHQGPDGGGPIAVIARRG
jgi:cyanuric acid amidohydrolase